jgi:hypothetical protein
MNEAAKIHTGGSYDFMAPSLPPGMTRPAAAAWIGEDPRAGLFRDLISAGTGTRRAAERHAHLRLPSRPPDRRA